MSSRRLMLRKRNYLPDIWHAADWDKKLSKDHVLEMNVGPMCEAILQPNAQMALRTSGNLMLGMVRIYSRKAKYLLEDCNRAVNKIRMNVRPGTIDLSDHATVASFEKFHSFSDITDAVNIELDEQLKLNQSYAEYITLKEDYGTLPLIVDDFEGMQDKTCMEDDGFGGIVGEGFLGATQQESVEVKDPLHGLLIFSKPATPKPQYQPNKVRKFATKRVRSHPYLQSEQIGTLHVDDTIRFVDELQNDDGVWVQLSPKTVKKCCQNGHTEAWCLKFN